MARHPVRTRAERLTADAAAAYPQRTIKIVASADTEVATISGDAGRIHQALLNLVVNACQHTEPHCRIEVSIETDQTLVHLSVIDHGSGVDLLNADQLFVAFARGDESRSRQSHDGAGLGLALVRRMADRHGGSAWVKETPGGGATFGFSLPLLPAGDLSATSA